MEATDPTGHQSWSPGELSPAAPVGADEPLADGGRRTASRIDPTAIPTVWWCDTTGGVLADGLWVGTGLFGAVVNLTGLHTPRLTIDRRRILSFSETEITRLLGQQVPALLADGATVLTHTWLSDLAGHRPDLADTICAAAYHHLWKVAGHTTDIALIGCFRNDGLLFRTGRDPRKGGGRAALPEFIHEWRLRAWAAAGLIDGLVPRNA